MKKGILSICREILVIFTSIFTMISVFPVFMISINAEISDNQNLNYVDLNNWIEHGDGNWNVEPGGRTVKQLINGRPTFFLSPQDHINQVITGTIRVDTASDDDFIGFVLGYENLGSFYDFVLFDWKQYQQDANPYGTGSVAEEGFTLGRFSGELSSTAYSGGLGDYSKYFWYHEEEVEKFELLGTVFGPDKGWNDFQEYTFKILYTHERIKIVIDNQVVFDVYDSFNAGKMGFYNYSQEGVVYGNVQMAPGTSVDANPIAQSDRYGMSMNTTLSVSDSNGVLFNDYDPNLDNMEIVLASDVSNGVLNINKLTGAFDYTPSTNFTGMDTFTYYLIDDNLDTSEVVSVEINVIEGENQAPTSLTLSNTLIHDSLLSENVLGTLSTIDPNVGDFHDYMLLENSEGRFSINKNRIVVNDFASMSPGESYEILVRTTDFQGLFLDQSFTVNVPYTVSFVDYDNTVLKNEIVVKGDSATPPSNLERVGYTFAGWDKAYDNVIQNLIIQAKYTAKSDTAYRVEHYQETLVDGNYVLVDTENLTGTTDTLVESTAKDYTGFIENITHVDRFVSDNLAGDGSLVLTRYYDRNEYTVSFMNWDSSEYYTQKQMYGEEIDIPLNPHRDGYTFNGWYKEKELSTTWEFHMEMMPASNVSLYAKYTAKSDTVYKVEHYQESIVDGEYVLYETETLTGTTDTLVESTANVYTGFIENITHVDRLVSDNLAGDGSLVLTRYYDRNEYTVSFMNWDSSEYYTQKQIYGEEIDIPLNPHQAGYTFNGWYKEKELSTTWEFHMEMMPADDISLYAKFTAHDDTPYKTEHYKESLNGEYTLTDTESLTGTTDALVQSKANDYTGFSENVTHIDRLVNDNLAGDGSLVLKRYYDRNEYMVSFVNWDNTGNYTQKQVYEEEIDIPLNPHRDGYTFNGWYKDSELTTLWEFHIETMPASNISLYAKYTAKSDTVYKVEHYQESIVDGEYVLYETETLTGTTDTLVESTANVYTGFTENATHVDRLVSDNLAGDGSLVLTRYYDRNEYTVSYFDWDASLYYSEQVAYDDEIILPSSPVRAGYTFDGWSDTFDVARDDINVYATYLKNPTMQIENKGEEIEITVEGLEGAISYSKEERSEDVISKLEIEILETSEVSESDSSILNGYVEEILKYSEYKQFILDITLFKIVGNTKEVYSEANHDITVSFALPSEFKGGEFKVLRIHNDSVESLEYEFNESTSMVTFKTNKFSIYAVVSEYEPEKIADMSNYYNRDIGFWLLGIGIVMITFAFNKKRLRKQISNKNHVNTNIS